MAHNPKRSRNESQCPSPLPFPPPSRKNKQTKPTVNSNGRQTIPWYTIMTAKILQELILQIARNPNVMRIVVIIILSATPETEPAPVRDEQKAAAGEGEGLKNGEGGGEGSLPSSPSPAAAFCSPRTGTPDTTNMTPKLVNVFRSQSSQLNG